MTDEIESWEQAEMPPQPETGSSKLRSFVFPEEVERQKSVQSRMVLSNEVPQNNLEWLNPPPLGEVRKQARKLPMWEKFRRTFKRVWNRHALWQYVFILLIAAVTILILNTLTQPTVRPGTTVGPRR